MRFTLLALVLFAGCSDEPRVRMTHYLHDQHNTRIIIETDADVHSVSDGSRTHDGRSLGTYRVHDTDIKIDNATYYTSPEVRRKTGLVAVRVGRFREKHD